MVSFEKINNEYGYNTTAGINGINRAGGQNPFQPQNIQQSGGGYLDGIDQDYANGRGGQGGSGLIGSDSGTGADGKHLLDYYG